VEEEETSHTVHEAQSVVLEEVCRNEEVEEEEEGEETEGFSPARGEHLANTPSRMVCVCVCVFVCVY